MRSTLYTLKDKEVTPCSDIDVWQKFMDDLPKRVVGSEQVGKFGVHTTFVGVNLGSEFMPKFFRTVITNDNGDNSPWLTETWQEAETKHKAVVRCAIAMLESEEREVNGEASGWKFTDCAILPDDKLSFVLESEEAARQMVPTASENWSRDGKTVVFHPVKK